MNAGTPPAHLPDDVEALKALVVELTEQHERALSHAAKALASSEEALVHRDEEIERLKGQVRLLLAQRFGPSSEKTSDAQLGLFNEAETEADKAEDEAGCGGEDERGESATPRRRGKRRPLPSHLPRVEIIHDLPECERVCPHDGTALEVIGEQTSEQLRIIPAQVEVVVHRRPKYACPCCRGHMAIAPMPPQPIPKSMASAELLAFVATGKYVDALPLYRQSKQLQRAGIELGTQTLARWMMALGALLTPLINLMRDELLSQTYMQMDESTFQVLKEPGKTPESLSRLWVQRAMDPARPVVLFSYRRERSGAVARELMGEFRGVRQSDGYAVYGDGDEGITAAYCWAHARRNFTDGLKSLGINPKRLPPGPPKKGKLLIKGLAFIRELYAIEKGLKTASVDERQAARAERSAKVLARLDQWRRDTQPKVRPGSDVGQALAYLEKYWDGLTYFVNDGRVLLDTNLTEGEIRPFAVGRRNWLFAVTPSGASASAAIYSVISTAKANGLEPYAYLRQVITRLPAAGDVGEVEALLPWCLTPEAIKLT